MATEPQRPEPSDWLFDGTDPAADLPADEAEQIAGLSIEFDDPICTPLPESAESAVSELFRGFYAHTPYRRLTAIERADETTLLVRAEKREHVDAENGWKPQVHDQAIEELQAQLAAFFGPLWRIRRRRATGPESESEPGTLVIRRVEGRQFHYAEDGRKIDE